MVNPNTTGRVWNWDRDPETKINGVLITVFGNYLIQNLFTIEIIANTNTNANTLSSSVILSFKFVNIQNKLIYIILILIVY